MNENEIKQQMDNFKALSNIAKSQKLYIQKHYQRNIEQIESEMPGLTEQIKALTKNGDLKGLSDKLKEIKADADRKIMNEMENKMDEKLNQKWQ